MATLFYSRLARPRRAEVQSGLVISLGMCMFSPSATPGHVAMVASCIPALLPSMTSAVQVCMLTQYIFSRRFCNGYIKYESFIHHIILYQKQQEKGII